MSQSVYSKKSCLNLYFFKMALRIYVQESSYINLPTNSIRKQNELAG